MTLGLQIVTTTRKSFLLAVAVLIAGTALVSLLFVFINAGSPAKESSTLASTTATSTDTVIGSLPTATMVASTTSALSNLGFEDGLAGWTAGSVTRDGEVPNQGYTVDVTSTVAHSGNASVYIQPTVLDPKRPPKTFGYISTRVAANIFRGKRVHFSAFLRTQDEVEAGLWMSVIGTTDGKPTDPALPMDWDNMVLNRAVHDTTDWHKYDIVLDVPVEADFLLLGLQSGYGQTWMDDVQLQIVGSDIQLTAKSPRRELNNLDFEHGLSPWEKQTLGIGQIDIGTSTAMAHSGKYAAYLKQIGGDLDGGTGLVYPLIYGGDYRDKRIQVSAYMNVDKAPRGAGLSVWAYYLDNEGKSAPPLTATTKLLPSQSGPRGWQKVEVTINVPDRASAITFNMGLLGDGEVWIDDVQLEGLGPTQQPLYPSSILQRM